MGGQTTEESFKSVAQAAVTNLILNANPANAAAAKASDLAKGKAGNSNDPDVVKAFGSKVDTSTAHIAALTSSNWVAACAGVPSISAAVPSSGISCCSGRSGSGR